MPPGAREVDFFGFRATCNAFALFWADGGVGVVLTDVRRFSDLLTVIHYMCILFDDGVQRFVSCSGGCLPTLF